jgi:hypothetical protein
MTREKLRLVYGKVSSLKNTWDDIAEDANLANTDGDLDILNENEEIANAQFKNKITLGNGLPTKPEHEKFNKLAHDNWKLISDMIVIIDKDLDKYSPQTYEDWVAYINAQVSWIVMTKPISDKKWQRTWLGWIEILRNYKQGGGTFASGRSAIPSGEYDLKTGRPIYRPITKEQIDATYVSKLNHMDFVCKNIPFFFQMFLNIDFTQLVERARRAVKLAPKLERQA